VIGTGDFLYGLGLAVMATMTLAVAPIIFCVFGGLFLYSMLQSSMISSLVGPVNMGAGVGVEVEENLPDLVAEAVTCKGGGGASVRDYVVEGIKQNQGGWAKMRLPNGCTFADSGCGPTVVAGVLMKKDMNLTPYNLVYEDGSPYNMSIGCSGSTMEQAKKSLKKHHDGKVTFNATTRSCSKKDIANWICEGKVVMVLANFYKNTKLEIGGHYFLAVEVKNGEIYSVDPFYDDGAVLDGTKEYGYVQALRDCMVIEVD